MSKIEIKYLPTFKKEKFVLPANTPNVDNLSELSLQYESQIYSECMLPGQSIQYLDHTKYSRTIILDQNGALNSGATCINNQNEPGEKVKSLAVNWAKTISLDESYIQVNVVNKKDNISSVERLVELMSEMNKFYDKLENIEQEEDLDYLHAFRIPLRYFSRLQKIKNSKDSCSKSELFFFVIQSEDDGQFYRAEFKSYSFQNREIKYNCIDYGGYGITSYENCYFLHKNFGANYERHSLPVCIRLRNFEIKNNEKLKEAERILKALTEEFIGNIYYIDYIENEHDVDGPLIVTGLRCVAKVELEGILEESQNKSKCTKTLSEGELKVNLIGEQVLFNLVNVFKKNKIGVEVKNERKDSGISSWK